MKKAIKIFLLLITILLLIGCSNKKEKVVIYSCLEEDRQQALVKQLKQEFPDIDVKVQYIPTGNVVAKIKNEGSRIEADIILGLETAHMDNLKDNFANLNKFNTKDIYLKNIPNTDNYLIWEKYTMNIIIDKTFFKKHKIDIPKTYKDLLKKEYKNLIAMPDLKTSATGYAFFLNVVNLMGEKKAVEYFKKLKTNLREFTTSGSGTTNLLKQGEIAIAMGMTAQGVSAINEGYDFKIVELETGSPYNTTTFGIIKGRENNENVLKVFEWLLNDFIYYDKENFVPDPILKNQNNKVKNYPRDLKDANMDGINDVKVKEHLTKVWNEING